MPNVTKPLTTINKLYKQGLSIIEHEMRCIKDLSIGGKLPSGPSKDLRDYMKLLEDLKRAHKAIEADKATKAKSSVSLLSDEELKAKLLQD